MITILVLQTEAGLIKEHGLSTRLQKRPNLQGFDWHRTGEYRASDEGQALDEYVERQLAERQNDGTFAVSHDAVKAQILADMNAVGRFSAVENEVDAMGMVSYFAARGADGRVAECKRRTGGA